MCICALVNEQGFNFYRTGTGTAKVAGLTFQSLRPHLAKPSKPPLHSPLRSLRSSRLPLRPRFETFEAFVLTLRSLRSPNSDTREMYDHGMVHGEPTLSEIVELAYLLCCRSSGNAIAGTKGRSLIKTTEVVRFRFRVENTVHSGRFVNGGCPPTPRIFSPKNVLQSSYFPEAKSSGFFLLRRCKFSRIMSFGFCAFPQVMRKMGGFFVLENAADLACKTMRRGWGCVALPICNSSRMNFVFFVLLNA